MGNWPIFTPGAGVQGPETSGTGPFHLTLCGVDRGTRQLCVEDSSGWAPNIRLLAPLWTTKG